MDFQTEKQIERAILEYLHYAGVTAWKQNNGAIVIKNIGKANRFYKTVTDHHGQVFKGIPDIVGYTPSGKALYIEVKKPGKKPSKEQLGFLQNALEAGCLAFWTTSVEYVQEVLRENGVL